MAAQCKSVTALLAAVVVLTTAGCTSEPTPDIEATVEAKVKWELAAQKSKDVKFDPDSRPETDVRIGDRFRLGEALLEVSQPRKPCWKIEHRFGRKGMVAHIVKTHISGWYYRVIEEGIAQAGDHLTKVDEGKTDWTVARLFAALYDPACKPTPDQLEEICMLEKLSEQVRLSLSRKL